MGSGACTLTVRESEAELSTLSYAVAWSKQGAEVKDVASHINEYGAVVDVPREVLSHFQSTFLTPLPESLTLAVSVTIPITGSPAAAG